jgi:hypothetical protein
MIILPTVAVAYLPTVYNEKSPIRLSLKLKVLFRGQICMEMWYTSQG